MDAAPRAARPRGQDHPLSSPSSGPRCPRSSSACSAAPGARAARPTDGPAAAPRSTQRRLSRWLSTFAFRAVDVAGVPVARRGRGRVEGAGHRAAAPARPDRPRRLREERGRSSSRASSSASAGRQHARPGRLLAPVRDPGRLGHADAALALHARGADRGREAQGGDRRRREPTSRPAARSPHAMERQPADLRPLFRAMVRSGESSGRLEEALERVAFQLEKLDALRRQVRSAMMYPALRLRRRDRGHARDRHLHRPGLRRASSRRSSPTSPARAADLPAHDPDHVGVSNFAHRLLVHLDPGHHRRGFIAFFRWKKTERGRAQWDRFKLRLPFKIGDVVQKVALARWSRTFSGTVASGVPMLQAIKLDRRDRRATPWSSRRWTTSTPRSSAAARSPTRSRRTRSSRRWSATWSSVGEETGQLEQMLDQDRRLLRGRGRRQGQGPHRR